MKAWYLYLIRCRDRSLYTGITTDVNRRFNEHQSNVSCTAKYLKGKGPLILAWQAKVGDKSTALKMEKKVKKLAKTEKEKLINGDNNVWDIT